MKKVFCDPLSDRSRREAAVASGAEAVKGAHIVNVITKASEPVLLGEWLEPGQHVNAAGSNSLIRRELDEAAVKRAGIQDLYVAHKLVQLARTNGVGADLPIGP